MSVDGRPVSNLGGKSEIQCVKVNSHERKQLIVSLFWAVPGVVVT